MTRRPPPTTDPPRADDLERVEVPDRISAEILRGSSLASSAAREGSLAPPSDVGVAAAVHEIQNVLTSVRGWVELARAHEDPALAARALAVIERGVVRASALAGAMTDPVTRFGVRARRFDLRTCLAQVVELLEGRARAMGVSISGPSSELSDTQVLGDPERVEQVLTNLCINALHAVSAARANGLSAGRVEVSLRDGEGAITAVVRDDGAGIDPAVRTRIFDPFFTSRGADDPAQAPGTGRGLGLAVSRALAEAMGGRLEVEPVDGQGTAMTLSLPRARSRASGEFALLSKAGSVDLRLRTGLRVLVLDDEAAIRELLEVALSLRGARVMTAGGPEAARKHVARGEVDVVLADEGLGEGVSGAAFLREVGSQFPRVGRVLMTGAADAGAWDDVEVVRKPFLLDDVVRALALALHSI